MSASDGGAAGAPADGRQDVRRGRDGREARGGRLRSRLGGRLRPRLRTGVRWKLSAAIALVGALVALALSLVVHNAARVSMLDSARDVQDERVQFAQRIYESTGDLQFGARVDDPALPKALRDKVREGRRATYVASSDGSDDSNGSDASDDRSGGHGGGGAGGAHSTDDADGSAGGSPDIWAAVPVKGGKVLSLHTGLTDGSTTVMRDLDQALILGSISVVFGGCALGVLIGGQLSRRLRKAAAAAGEVAQGRTDVRVREAIGGVVKDETDDLARSVDAMADALKQRLEAERRVTADIAHELRTPVTGLVTAAELLPPGRPSELVKDRAQAIRTLVEDVLEVARLDSAAERAELQDILLGEFVARRVAVLSREATVRVVRESAVTTDPRRLERILGNLLANAARHGEPPVEVTVDGRVVRVRDHGVGFPEELIAEGPSRFRTGSSDRAGHGHGLGLTIAAGQARVLGARLTFRNVLPEAARVPARGGDGGGGAAGAVAVLWLPEHAPTNTGSFPVLAGS
ncbi:sensor histidine kinase [Streptomyces sp. NPDC050560]|uniref:sensor histidine kinase n=1 Tax=Streptomyces sp. NPDC050560 TaxID=3365630 RepID=UPI00378F2E5F